MATQTDLSELKAAVAELYRVFKAYQIGTDFGGCKCCVDPYESARLAEAPLPELMPEDLRRYAFKALTTWGEVWHFKHFLPRLFELAAADPSGFSDFEVLLGKLDRGLWEHWPDHEWQAVDRFLKAIWSAELSRDVEHTHDDRTGMILCGVGRCYGDLSPFLQQWIDSNATAATDQLAHFFLLNYDDLLRHRKLSNAFWDDRREQEMQVISWLRSPSVYEYLFDREAHLDERLKMAIPLLAEWQSEPS